MRRNKQSGVTFIGWVILLTPMALVLYAGIRALPVYLNYLKVVKTLEGTKRSLAGGANASSIKNEIDRHFEIDMVNYPDSKDFKITHDAGAWVVEAAYDDEAPLFDGISLHFVFDKIVRIGAE